MNAINQIIIEGNVTRDSSIKATAKGTKVATMPIASNRSYRDFEGNFQNEVSYFDIEAWGDKLSEKVVQNGVKGRGARVIGRLKHNQWKAEDGTYHDKYIIIAEHIEFKPVKKEATITNAQKKDSAASMAVASAGNEYPAAGNIPVQNAQTAEITF